MECLSAVLAVSLPSTALAASKVSTYWIYTYAKHRKQFKGEYELTSLIGNITKKDNKYYSHTHITFSDIDYNVFGGHLFDAKISAAGEFIIYPDKKEVNRKLNPKIGLSFWCLENTFKK